MPTIGGLASHLVPVRRSPRYEHVLDYLKTTLSRTPVVGRPLHKTLHGIKKGIKDVLQPQVLFEDLGLKYVGPIDGHDEATVEYALRDARGFGAPVIVHVITRKGFRYAPADSNDVDCLHQVGPDTDPTVLRYPKATAGDDVAAVGKLSGMDVLARPVGHTVGTGHTDGTYGAAGRQDDVLLVGAGVMAGVCAQAASRLADQGIGVTVVDPLWVKPVDEALVVATRGSRLVVMIESKGRAGGFGGAVGRFLRDRDVDTPARMFGLPQEFLGHGDTATILAGAGLIPQHLVRQVTEIGALAAKRSAPIEQHSQAG